MVKLNQSDVSVKKSKGRYYTPSFIVRCVLDLSDYSGAKIIKKHVIDNSCGDGAFLIEVVSRYCEQARKLNFSKAQLKAQLETYIHGIEIDEIESEKCKKNLDKAAKSAVDISCVNWDIKCANALAVREYDGKMDYVVGNPPYIRVHNLGESFDDIKQFLFAQSGMTDIYIVFYEIGIRMLNRLGVLGYITPSSFFTSVAGKYMRSYLVLNNLVEKLVDFKHFQVFSAITYSTILVLNKNKKTKSVDFYEFDENKKLPRFVDKLNTNDFYIANNFYFSNRNNLYLLKKIFNNYGASRISVKNGYATLCDNVFVGDFDFKSQYIIPVVKASTGEKKQIFYPYDKNSRLVPSSEIKKEKILYDYLLKNIDSLKNRDLEKDADSNWYAFGRSQSIGDTYKNKLAVNTLLRTSADLKLVSAPAGVGVYSGLYILCDDSDLNRVMLALQGDDFMSYVSLLGKYKNGGYYTFSSKELKSFLDYKLSYSGGLFNEYE